MNTPTVLITGSNRGIGLQFTRSFLSDGWQVIACCREPGQATELQALGAGHPDLEIQKLDVTDYQAMADLSAQLKDRKIDILLSNAGTYGPRTRFGEVDVSEWRHVFEVNTIAPLKLAELFVEQVAASELKLIAMLSSKMGSIDDNGSGGGYIYRSSKTALNQVVKSLSIDLAERNISVVALHPGWVQTDMGGINAETTVEDSVRGMRSSLQTAGERSGQFIDLDGSIIPW